jgi:hypothetical protein
VEEPKLIESLDPMVAIIIFLIGLAGTIIFGIILYVKSPQEVTEKMSKEQPIENQTPNKPINYKNTLVLGLRFFQVLTTSFAIVGFIWGAGDFITSLFPSNSAVTPLSVLLMLYGVIGSAIIEVSIRLVQRKK